MKFMNKTFPLSHPELALREDVVPALRVTVTTAAEQLGVARPALSQVLNTRAAISLEMALRIQAWFGIKNGGSASVWLVPQSAYDLWKARKTIKPKVKHARIPQLLAG
jgi:addiction module HigA family antidote